MIQQVTIQMTSARTYVLEGNKKCDQLNPKELMLLAGVTCAGMTAMDTALCLANDGDHGKGARISDPLRTQHIG